MDFYWHQDCNDNAFWICKVRDGIWEEAYVCYILKDNDKWLILVMKMRRHFMKAVSLFNVQHYITHMLQSTEILLARLVVNPGNVSLVLIWRLKLMFFIFSYLKVSQTQYDTILTKDVKTELYMYQCASLFLTVTWKCWLSCDRWKDLGIEQKWLVFCNLLLKCIRFMYLLQFIYCIRNYWKLQYVK